MQAFPSNRANESFDEGMRERRVRHRLDGFHFEDAQVRLPLVALVQPIMVRAEVCRWGVTTRRSVERATEPHAIHCPAVIAKSHVRAVEFVAPFSLVLLIHLRNQWQYDTDETDLSSAHASCVRSECRARVRRIAMRMWCRSIAMAVVCVMWLPAVLAGQGSTGSIGGAVRDTSGGVLPGVTV